MAVRDAGDLGSQTPPTTGWDSEGAGETVERKLPLCSVTTCVGPQLSMWWLCWGYCRGQGWQDGRCPVPLWAGIFLYPLGSMWSFDLGRARGGGKLEVDGAPQERKKGGGGPAPSNELPNRYPYSGTKKEESERL